MDPRMLWDMGCLMLWLWSYIVCYLFWFLRSELATEEVSSLCHDLKATKPKVTSAGGQSSVPMELLVMALRQTIKNSNILLFCDLWQESFLLEHLIKWWNVDDSAEAIKLSIFVYKLPLAVLYSTVRDLNWFNSAITFIGLPYLTRLIAQL